MTEIVAAVRLVDHIMKEIVSASAQQRQEIDQLRTTVDKIDRTSQQHALLVRAAEAAESMQSQAQELLAAVSAFRLHASPSVSAYNARDAIAGQAVVPAKRPVLM
jgi:methyl-accepting chemotaxis protein